MIGNHVALVVAVLAAGACAPRRSTDASTCPCTCASSADVATVASASASSAPSSVVVINSAAPGTATDALEVAQEKSALGDGKGCLAALDVYDAGSKHPSTDPLSNAAMLRVQCLEKTGQCQKAKELLTKFADIHYATTMDAEHRERFVEISIVHDCENTADLSPREQLVKAYLRLQDGAYMKQQTPAECSDEYQAVKKLAPWIPPKNDEDQPIKDGQKTLYVVAANCCARAGDCACAKKLFDDGYPAPPAGSKPLPPGTDLEIRRKTFDAAVAKCKGSY